MKSMSSNTKSNGRPLARDIGMVLLGTALILLFPLVAMQLTTQVNWSLFDFVLMGALIATTGEIPKDRAIARWWSRLAAPASTSPGLSWSISAGSPLPGRTV